MVDPQTDLKVAVRLCPLPPGQKRFFLSQIGQELTLANPLDPEERNTWTFPVILHKEAMQQQVYGEVGGTIVEDVMSHSNGCCLVYGQAKAGKTFTVFGDQGVFELTIRRLVAEIKGDERGLKASLACVSWKEGKARDVLRTEAEDYELLGNMDLFGIPNTTWISVKTAAEVLTTVRRAVAPFEALESAEKPNVFVLLTVSRAKNLLSPIGSMIIGEMATQTYSDSLSQSLNHTSLLHPSLVVLSKVLAELGGEDRDDSVLVSKAMNGNWSMSLLACVTASGLEHTDCFNVLKYASTAMAYPEMIRKLKKGEQQDASVEDKRIMQLSKDIIDIRFDLQQTELLHSKRLKDLGVKFNLDFDLNILKDIDPGSKEARAVKSLKEGVEKLESYKDIRTKSEHKLHKLTIRLAEAKQISAALQARHFQELATLNESISLLQDLIDQVKPEPMPEHLVREAQENKEALEGQKPVLQRLSQSLADLHSVVVQRSELAEADTDARATERESLDIVYKKDYKSQEFLARDRLHELEDSYKKTISDRETARQQLETKVRLQSIKQHDIILEHQSECGRLAVLAKGYFDLLEKIKRGDFNEGVLPVVIPRSHFPEFPDAIVNKYLHSVTGYTHLPRVVVKEKKAAVGRRESILKQVEEPSPSRVQARLRDSLGSVAAMMTENATRRQVIADIANEMEDLRSTRIMYKRLLRQQKQANRVSFRQTISLSIESNKEVLRHVFVTVQPGSALSSHESSLSSHSSFQASASVLSVRSKIRKPRGLSEVAE